MLWAVALVAVLRAGATGLVWAVIAALVVLATVCVAVPAVPL